jgi:Ig-like domain from next to BRCA1 gene
MQKHISTLLAVTLAAFMLVSCAGEAPTDEVNTIMTAAVSTMVASFFDTQTAIVTPATSTSISTSTSTLTPLPTFTPFSSPTVFASSTFIYYTPTLGSLTPGTPTATGTLATATINPSVLAYGCNNLAFIRDVTVPAGTVINKNQDFTKTWKVQNTGTCNWLYQYGLVLLSGERYGGKDTKIQRLVTVNDWSEVSVNMTAPKNPGTYINYWRMTDTSGHMFGATLVVSFVVAAPPAPTKTPVPTSTFTLAPTDTETPTLTATP